MKLPKGEWWGGGGMLYAEQLCEIAWIVLHGVERAYMEAWSVC